MNRNDLFDDLPSERELREQIAMHGRSLFERGFTCGSSGNISVRTDDYLLVTPTNCCLGRLDPERISKLDLGGDLLAGDRPSKETFLHLAMYQSRPLDRAIVHLHSTHSVAVSCLEDTDPSDLLPPLTAYYVMRVGRLPLVPYYAPGDRALADAVREQARHAHSLLLANHGPVISGRDLDAAVYTAEELEETAKLYLLLAGRPFRPLTAAQTADLKERFPN